jgi:hypothetical protein
MRSPFFFSIYLVLPAVLWPWGSTQPLTEMSTRNLPGVVKDGRLLRLTTSPPSVSRLSSECSSRDISQPYGSPRSVAEIYFIENRVELPGFETVGCYSSGSR